MRRFRSFVEEGRGKCSRRAHEPASRFDIRAIVVSRSSAADRAVTVGCGVWSVKLASGAEQGGWSLQGARVCFWCLSLRAKRGMEASMSRLFVSSTRSSGNGIISVREKRHVDIIIIRYYYNLFPISSYRQCSSFAPALTRRCENNCGNAYVWGAGVFNVFNGDLCRPPPVPPSPSDASCPRIPAERAWL